MTAVEYLVKGLPMVYWEDPYYSDLLEQAKEMEKQQQSYNEEEVKILLRKFFVAILDEDKITMEQWFELNKKK